MIWTLLLVLGLVALTVTFIIKSDQWERRLAQQENPSNELVRDIVRAEDLYGTIRTAEQPSITSVGRLASLDATLQSAVQPGITGLGTQGQDLDMGSYRISNLAGPPTTALQAANKQYVDNYVQGTVWRDACVDHTTADLGATYDNDAQTLAKTDIVNGYTVSNGQRFLVKDQTNANENGIYVLTNANLLTRADDMDNSPVFETRVGTAVLVTSDSTRYIVTHPTKTANSELVVGTDDMVWVLFSATSNDSSNPYLLMEATTQQNISASTQTPVEWKGTGSIYNEGGFTMDANNTTFTVPRTGLYSIHYDIFW